MLRETYVLGSFLDRDNLSRSFLTIGQKEISVSSVIWCDLILFLSFSNWYSTTFFARDKTIPLTCVIPKSAVFLLHPDWEH